MLQIQYMLQNMKFPQNINCFVIPFSNRGQLLPCILTSKMVDIEMYDLYPNANFILQRDVLINPPIYDNKYVISKPPIHEIPENSILFQIYHQNNTYKCFIDSIINTKCCGGVMIIPFIFWCSSASYDMELRQRFLHRYHIPVMNIFNGIVCNFRNSMTCCFQFVKRRSLSAESPPSPLQATRCHIYPGNNVFDYTFEKNNGYAYTNNNPNAKK